MCYILTKVVLSGGCADVKVILHKAGYLYFDALGNSRYSHVYLANTRTSIRFETESKLDRVESIMKTNDKGMLDDVYLACIRRITKVLHFLLDSGCIHQSFVLIPHDILYLLPLLCVLSALSHHWHCYLH